MMTRTCFFLMAGCLAAAPMLAQHAGNVRYHGSAQTTLPDDHPPVAPSPNPQLYTFTVNGLYNAEADAYVAIFNLLQLGETAEEADRLIQERVQAFREDLAGLGIPAAQVFTDMISQIAIYEYQVEKKLFSKDNYLEIPKGIEIQKNLHIRFADGSKLDAILAAAARHEIYDLVKVDYYLEDQAAIFQELQRELIAFHQQQIKQYQTLGVRFDTAKVNFSAATSVSFPISRYQSYSSNSAATLKGLKDETGVQQIRKANTLYYQALPTHDYEVVVHPVVEAPVVQFAYTLTVMYQFVAPPQVQIQTQVEIQREKEYIWITEEGEVKTLDIVKQVTSED